MYTKEENQIIQTYISFKFLFELHELNFVNSDSFLELNFKDFYVKDKIAEMGIMNQGMIPPVLYMLLVMPKEMLSKELEDEYKLVNDKIALMKLSYSSTYYSDKHRVDYVRHIRNAVSHMSVEYPTGSILFKDSRMTNPKRNQKPKKEYFEVTVSNQELGCIVGMLNDVFIKYIQSIQQKQRATEGVV